jgi:hypothetical protein
LIKISWKLYKSWCELSNPIEERNCRFVRRIRMTEVKGALRKDENKVVEPDEIPNKFRSTWVMSRSVGWQTSLLRF